MNFKNKTISYSIPVNKFFINISNKYYIDARFELVLK